MSATTSSPAETSSGGRFSSARFRTLLVVWTIGIWGSRLRNIANDDELAGFELATSLGIAVFLIISAITVGVAMFRDLEWQGRALGVLVIAGIARFSIRGIAILASDEWGIGFKVVHTILWAVTVILSALAAREYSKKSNG